MDSADQEGGDMHGVWMIVMIVAGVLVCLAGLTLTLLPLLSTKDDEEEDQ